MRYKLIPFGIGLAFLPIYVSSCKKHTQKRKVSNLIQRFKEDHGIPGIAIAITHNNQIIYRRGFGYSDVENNIKAHSGTLMRIASISKAITSLIAGKLIEDGKLDLDCSINQYLPELQSFLWNDKQVHITPRHLLSHTSGIRHYEKDISLEKETKDAINNKPDSTFIEFYSKENYKSVHESLKVFINDRLIFEPGTNYYYTTHGFTLLSAVLDRVAKRPFSELLTSLFKHIGMSNTYLDESEPLIPNRAKYYKRDEKHRLTNVPYVNNSNKWAGGGLVSTCNDLLMLGNHLLKCYQFDSDENLLKRDTMKLLWTPQSNASTKYKLEESKNKFLRPLTETTYGLGWFLCHRGNKLKYAYHTGGAVGCSSCLLIVPMSTSESMVDLKTPQGYVVSILCNSQNASGILNLCMEIVHLLSE